MVGKEYWARGYFYNIDRYEQPLTVNGYGFYNIGKGVFSDEYGNELSEEPNMLGTYGVSTISGIARRVNQELIIQGII